MQSPRNRSYRSGPWPRCRAPGALVAPALALLLCACAGQPESHDLAAADPDTAPQLASLERVYFANTPMPPLPAADEIDEAERRVASARPWERELLTDLYPNAPSLWALAIRDTDGDGIADYRISDYYGKFLEGDTDVDGDGIVNVLDAAPYDVSPATAGDGILPAHLRWSAAEKPGAARRIQEALYRDHNIVLVERGASFTPELVGAIDDTVTRVYRSVFGNGDSLSTLRVITTEESSLLYADAEEGAGDFAQVFAATQTLEIYRPGIDAPPAIQLGFLAHELGHNLQFALDDVADREAIVSGGIARADRFHALVAAYGWERIALPDDPAAYFELFRPQYVAPEPWEYLYEGETLPAWEEWLAAIYDETGEEGYLADNRLVSAQVLGDYSLASPWEWYSDHLIAYLYLAMFDALRETCAPEAVNVIEQAFQDEVVAAWWPYFRFVNARGAPFQDWLSEAYPLEPADVRALAADYLSGHAEAACVIESVAMSGT